MSIATDEAYKRYPSDAVLATARENNICRRTGYIAGRTAEPTDAEIEAGAIAIFSRLTTSAHHMGNDDYVGAWHCIAPEQREEFRAQSKAVLEDARKAVTGDERGY